MELTEFLVDAKKYTYSYGGSRKYKRLNDGSYEFFFVKKILNSGIDISVLIILPGRRSYFWLASRCGF